MATPGTYNLCYKVGTNPAFQTGITLEVTADTSTCEIPVTVAPGTVSWDEVVQVTITFDGTYDATTHAVDSQFATDVMNAMALSLCDDCSGNTLTEWLSRIRITDITAGSIIVVSEIAPADGETTD